MADRLSAIPGVELVTTSFFNEFTVRLPKPAAPVVEALACGTPVAAFPVTGPLDVIADHPIGAIDRDLRAACLRALEMSRERCRNFALERSWENSTRQFLGNLTPLQPSRSLRPVPRVAGQSTVQG